MSKQTFIRELVKVATGNNAATAAVATGSFLSSLVLINSYSKPSDNEQKIDCLGRNDNVDYTGLPLLHDLSI